MRPALKRNGFPALALLLCTMLGARPALAEQVASLACPKPGTRILRSDGAHLEYLGSDGPALLCAYSMNMRVAKAYLALFSPQNFGSGDAEAIAGLLARPPGSYLTLRTRQAAPSGGYEIHTHVFSTAGLELAEAAGSKRRVWHLHQHEEKILEMALSNFPEKWDRDFWIDLDSGVPIRQALVETGFNGPKSPPDNWEVVEQFR